MKTPKLIALTFALTLQATWGAATVNFSSSLNETNILSDGSPMSTDFEFQIGTFTGGFEPTAENTSEWLGHWVALSDAAADPLPGATAKYELRELPAPFPASAGFAGSTVLDHNQPPFQAMGAVYIWGYNNRTSAGAGEWLLVTGSTWGWPSGTTNPPATLFTVSGADTVILGAVNGPDFHMRSASVTVEQSAAAPGYAAWLESNFSATTLADAELADTVWGVLADADEDGLSNIVEFYTGSDPTDAASKNNTAADVEDDTLVFSFYQAKDTTGAAATVEWSDDATHWHTADEIVFEVAEDLGDVLRIEARLPIGDAANKFARLNVRRVFE